MRSEYVNEVQKFSVTFQSSFEEDTSVRWLLNNVPLEDESIVATQYDTQDTNTGTTSLQFSPLTRADKGTYTVIISNTMSVIPVNRRSVDTNFRINVVGKFILSIDIINLS